MLAWLSNQYNWQIDLTSNQRHSLDRQSIELLEQMQDTIQVHAYVREATTRQAVQEILKRYQRIKTDIQLTFYNPDIDIEQAKQDNITLKKPVEFAIHYQSRRENIYSLSENSISNALFRLSQQNTQTVQFLSGHNERNPFDNSRLSYARLRASLASKGIKLDTLNLLVSAIPEQTRLLVIAAPEKKLADGEIAQIKSYLDGGGNLLWLTDPGNLQGMDSIAETLGLQFLDGVIVDSNTNLRQSLNIQHPAIIPVIEYSDDVLTKALNYTLFPISRGLRLADKSPAVWQAVPFLQSLPKSWQETGDLGETVKFDPKQGDIAGPITLGIAFSRDIPAHTSNAFPASSKPPSQQRIIIIGDSDFMADSYIGAGDNRQLALNIFNWLNNNDKHLSIPAPESRDRSLVLSDTQLAIIGFGFFLALPIGLIITGLLIWYRRKHR